MANLTRALAMPDGTEYEFIGKAYYASCSYQPASSGTLTVSVPGFTSSSLVAGVRVSIRFEQSSNNFSAALIYLNVSNTGSKSIRIASDAYTNMPNTWGLWSAGQVVDFVYDGTEWVICAPSKLTLYTDCYTAADTAAKTTVVNGFSKADRALLAVCFAYGNTAGSPTLNVNSLGAFPIVTIRQSSPASYITVGKYSAGYHLLMLEKSAITGYTYVWNDLTYLPISDEMNSSSSITYASSKAVRSAYNLASSKYSKPLTGIPASDLASGVIPSSVSELTNDAGYITLADLPIYDGSVT